MLSYTYEYNVHINTIYNEPEENHINSILKTHPNIYIISFSKLMDESWQYLTKLFVDKMIKLGCLNMSKLYLSCQMS